MKPPKLKPCPFCGAKARVYVNGPYVSVGCSAISYCGVVPRTSEDENQAGSCASWNRRTPTRKKPAPP